jgi:hypothetical protein
MVVKTFLAVVSRRQMRGDLQRLGSDAVVEPE